MPGRSRGLSQQASRCQIVIGGVPTGEWRSADDAESSWDNQKTRPGSQGKQEIVKALVEYGDREFERSINIEDVTQYLRWREQALAPDVTVTEDFLGAEGTVVSTTSVGAAANLTIGGSDYDSSDVRTVTLSMHVEDVK